ncbi:carboxypeptidase-like protein [Myroides indicus]|uniref:Carboxypeptidase-like protein n=2 Tax=Myroides indicus TaxID=1323422 RepID=A0A4R7F657_9FLAO|nr:carboxypeptidase-like protein [Myroides indicus]
MPKPCAENWDKMTAIEKGRHCAVCQKTVYDLSDSTKPELFAFLQQNKGICAKIPVNLLDEVSQPIVSKRNLYAATVALAAVLSTAPVVAQNTNQENDKKEIRKTFRMGEPEIQKIIKDTENEYIISGQVFSEGDGFSLPGARIAIFDTDVEVYTDMDGKFKITVYNNNNAKLMVSFIGYITEIIPIIEKEKLYNIYLKEEPLVIGEVMFITGKPVISSNKKSKKRKE